MPGPIAVRAAYHSGAIAFPYWSQVWPAARALAQWLANNPEHVQGKTVVEVAAGLGLPSLMAARLGARVACTEGAEEAIGWIRASAEKNGFTSFSADRWNWNDDAPLPPGDVLLLSDINYEPAAFAQLEARIHEAIGRGTEIILSTPQRLMGKTFMEKLLPLAKHSETTTVDHGGETVWVSVVVVPAKAGIAGPEVI